jgi:hypothetical protein
MFHCITDGTLLVCQAIICASSNQTRLKEPGVNGATYGPLSEGPKRG